LKLIESFFVFYIEGKGGVSKEALAHIIASLLRPSKELSHQNYIRLLEKLGLRSQTIIKYDDFRFCFDGNMNLNDSLDLNEGSSSDHFRNISSVQVPTSRTVGQTFVILKEKAKLK
jgi:hypothetical protein